MTAKPRAAKLTTTELHNLDVACETISAATPEWGGPDER